MFVNWINNLPNKAKSMKIENYKKIKVGWLSRAGDCLVITSWLVSLLLHGCREFCWESQGEMGSWIEICWERLDHWSFLLTLLRESKLNDEWMNWHDYRCGLMEHLKNLKNHFKSFCSWNCFDSKAYTSRWMSSRSKFRKTKTKFPGITFFSSAIDLLLWLTPKQTTKISITSFAQPHFRTHPKHLKIFAKSRAEREKK